MRRVRASIGAGRVRRGHEGVGLVGRQHAVDDARRAVFPRVAGAALRVALPHRLAPALVPASRVLEFLSINIEG